MFHYPSIPYCSNFLDICTSLTERGRRRWVKDISSQWLTMWGKHSRLASWTRMCRNHRRSREWGEIADGRWHSGAGTWYSLLAMQTLQRRQTQSMPWYEVFCYPSHSRFSCQSGWYNLHLTILRRRTLAQMGLSKVQVIRSSPICLTRLIRNEMENTTFCLFM